MSQQQGSRIVCKKRGGITISVYSITEENKDVFCRLAPDYLLCNLEQNDHLALGAVGGEPGAEYAAGVLVFDVIAGSNGIEDLTIAELRWLYVAQEHRREGHGDALVTEFLSIVHKSGLLHVMCDLPFSEEYDLLCGFLEAWEFEFRLQNLYELDISVGEVQDTRLFGKAPPVGVIPLHAVDAANFYHFVQQVKKLPYVLANLSAVKEDYDADTSCLYLENGVAKGGLLVACNSDGSLALLLLRSLKNSPAILTGMTVYSANAAVKKYPPDKTFHLCCNAGFAGELIAKLFPERQPAIVRRGYYGIDSIPDKEV